MAEIAVGTNNQTFQVIFDTGNIKLNHNKIDVFHFLGSDDILINSELCLTPDCVTGKQYKGEVHYPFMREFVFGSGIIVGVLSKADFYLNKTEIKDVLFYEVLAEMDMISEDNDMDGIIGLGLGHYKATPNFVEYLVRQEHISNLFSVYLNRKEDSNKSKIIFGGIQKKFFKGTPKYYNVKDKNYWAIEMEGVFVGNNDTGLCSKRNKCKAIIDTGTSFIASATSNVIQIASLKT